MNNNTNDTLTLRLSLTVRYNLNGTAPRHLRNMMDTLPIHISGEGLLTGETSAEVEQYEASLTELHSAPEGVEPSQTETDTARAEWKEAVANESTRLGFAQWCEHQATIKPDARESSVAPDVLAALAAALN